MKIIKEIAGRFFALWGIVWFVPTMIIAMIFYAPCYLMKEPQSTIWFRHVSNVWMTIYLNIIGCPLRVRGAEHFRQGQNYVIVCNHNSLMDVPVATPFMPRANKTIAKKSMAKIPVFGWIYRLGSVLVDRADDKSRRQSFDDMKHVLSTGLDMVIYPEGTRNRTGQPLKSFYDGAFKLAAATGKPIIPAILFNTGKVLPVKKVFFLWPHRLQMHFLPAIESTEITIEELKEKVFRSMWDYYEANK